MEQKEKFLNPKEIETNFINLCTQVIKPLGLELYDLEWKGANTAPLLRVFIVNESSNSATLDECVQTDKALTPHLLALPWIPENIVLEVSSPGLYRQLKNLDHYRRVINKTIKIKLKQTLEDKYPHLDLPKKIKSNKTINGKVIQVEPKNIRINLNYNHNRDYEDDNNRSLLIDLTLDDIARANLDPELDFKLDPDLDSNRERANI